MIDTIFYFPDSLTYNDYLSKLNSDASDGIAPHVIVFAGQQKAIYLKGLRFSTNSSDIQSVVDQSRYDDTYIKGQIQSILSDVAQAQADMQDINTRINGIHQYEQSQIEDIANGAIAKSQYIKDKIAELGDQFKGYIKTEGFDDLANTWALEYIIPSIDGEGEGITFSDLVAKADIIKASVDKITTSIGEDGSKLKNILESYIQTTVANDETVAEIRSAWALQEENKDVLEWMTSSFKSYASGNKTFAQVLSSAQANAASGAAQTAVANLKTEIMRDINGDIKDVVSDMVSSVSTTDANNNTTVTATSIASAIANSTEAKTTLGAYFTDENKVNNLVQTKLNASVDGASWSSFVARVAEDHTAVGDISTRVGELEGVDVVTSSMISSIVDQNGNITAAAIIAAVNGDESEITLSADKINLNGTTFLQRLISQFENKKVEIAEGQLSVLSANRIWSYISKLADSFTITQNTSNDTFVGSYQDTIRIDGNIIYNETAKIVSLEGAELNQQEENSLNDIFNGTSWRIGFKPDIDSDGKRIPYALTVNTHQGTVVMPNMEYYNSIAPYDSGLFTIATKHGFDAGISGYVEDIPAGIYCEGTILCSGWNNPSEAKWDISKATIINPGDIQTDTLTTNSDITVCGNIRVLDETSLEEGITQTINLPSTVSGKHYEMVITKGIITGCTLVND